ncbi:hypothetical protein P4H65_05610 [Paenibacillus chitinolyticus]|uniref:hypothetical protein n=1 Tax=Paenibacillus chitinolyticus TaxID=79263 RepID=UPI002DB67730|nr:hypothetical protein [Paenibacillus chitinolyticus]MEC0245270.1 hypothetical protein [Paenibacillus chitinolyticus]
MTNNVINTVLVVVLAVVSFFTGEVVTFIMLGFILMSLITITAYLRKIYETLNRMASEKDRPPSPPGE